MEEVTSIFVGYIDAKTLPGRRLGEHTVDAKLQVFDPAEDYCSLIAAAASRVAVTVLMMSKFPVATVLRAVAQVMRNLIQPASPGPPTAS
jgi:hypothetical protein